MRDYLIRGVALDGRVRVMAVRTTELAEQLRLRQGTWPTATAALGRAATAGAMMGCQLKDEQKLTIQIRGNGPIGQLMIDANAAGDVRGFVDHPQTHLPSNAAGKLDVAGAVGTDGFLYVTKDLGLKEPYRGSVPIISGELAEDFTNYFTQSEQTPSAVALGVLVDRDGSVKAAGGFILQVLPGIEEEHIARLEAELRQMIPLTTQLDEGRTPEEIVQRIVGPIVNLQRMPVQFKCRCSLERVEQTLISLGRAELTTMLEQDKQAEIVCHFCNEAYRFQEMELRVLIDQLDS